MTTQLNDVVGNLIQGNFNSMWSLFHILTLEPKPRGTREPIRHIISFCLYTN